MAPYQYGTWFSVGRFHTELRTKEVAECVQLDGCPSHSEVGLRQIHTTWIVGL